MHTPANQRVFLRPHTAECPNCHVLQNQLDGALAKIKRLQESATKQAKGDIISSTARQAAAWANREEEE